MNPAAWAIVISIAVFFGMMVCLELGYRVGHRSSTRAAETAHEGVGAIEAAVFALLGLLLGFSFAGGMSRLESKRLLIIEEANAVGTAYLRLDLLPTNERTAMRRLFRDYLDARLRVYSRLPDRHAAELEMTEAGHIQQEIWTRAVTISSADASHNTARLLLPAINAMIDITTARKVAMYTHLPSLIFGLLISVALLSGLLAGYAMAKRRSRSWLHLVLYAAVVSITVYAVLDLEYPRYGLIRLDAADNNLRQLRDSIR